MLNVWDGMTYGWPFFAAIIPEGQEAIDQMGAYISLNWPEVDGGLPRTDLQRTSNATRA